MARAATEKQAPAALPADLLAALEGVTVHVRAEAEQVIIHFPGGRGWHHGREADATALRRLYPELNDAQVDRACRALAGIVAAHMRAMNGPWRRQSWVHDYGERSYDIFY